MAYIIRGGLLYDGSGKPPIKKDILVKDAHIEAIENKVCVGGEYVAIDATGCVVTPGFIDIHRHCDIQPLLNERFGELESLQGITSVVAGNCGLAPVPYTEKSGNDVLNLITPCLGAITSESTFSSFRDYTQALEKGFLNLNFGFLVGTGAIKASVKGFSKVPFSPDEMELAKIRLIEGLQNGAFGASIGIMYPPECYSSEDEFLSLIAPVSDYNGIICCHMRGEGDSLISSVEEIIRICEKAGCRLNISHFKATGTRNWNNLIYEATEVIDQARRRGLDVTADFYPYDGGSTTLQSLIPPDCTKGSITETCDFLSSCEGKHEFRRSITKKYPLWDNMVESIGWDRVVISSVEHEEYKRLEGRNFVQAAALMDMDEAELACTLYSSQEGRVGITVMSMKPEDVDYVASLPYTSVISDALYGGGSCPHPRLYGSFPKFIRQYVFEKKLMSLETAIYKMTALPASKIRLTDRGLIKAGMFADINVFSTDKFKSEATYTTPNKKAEGLRYCLINGKIVVRNGVWIENCSQGRLLKNMEGENK